MTWFLLNFEKYYTTHWYNMHDYKRDFASFMTVQLFGQIDFLFTGTYDI